MLPVKPTLGYALSSEEHEPADLVRHATQAEEAGFTFALISDHFHPWTDRQGQSSFVWSTLGGIAAHTSRIQLGTGVTCPLLRIHPAVIAQAAATLGSMARGRFFLGVGTGENLNEHIIGEHWPPATERLEMLEEAIDLMRTLWEGGLKSYRGHYYTVENARIYTLPEEPVRVYVAASGEESAQLAGEIGDGLIAVSPDAEVVRNFELEGGSGKPRLGQVAVCWAEDEARARRTARELWPISGIAPSLKSELPLPMHFEDASQKVTEDDIAQRVPCGPDAQRHIDAIEEFANAGFDHIYIHQIGNDQEGFFRFYQREILPRFAQHPARLASETPGSQAA